MVFRSNLTIGRISVKLSDQLEGLKKKRGTDRLISYLSPLYICGFRGKVACLQVITLLEVAFKSILDPDFSDDVELISGELGSKFKGFS